MYNKIIGLLLLFSAVVSHLTAQIFPKESSKLNYRIIGFSFPVENNKISNFKIEIADGTFQNEDSFGRNILKTIDCDTNKIIIEVPFFGHAYTWRVISGSNNFAMGPFHHFSIGTIPEIDEKTTRFRITKTAEKYKDAYVFLDANKALYDMNGKPVWYLPEINGSNNDTHVDLKITPQGTITLILGDNGYEINYDGRVKWEAPRNGQVNGDSVEHFHHQLTKLANGDYMILGVATAPWDMEVKNGDSSRKVKADLPFGTVIEYDPKGNVVWSWKSSDYFLKSDAIYYKNREGKPGIDVHENAFFFDEKAKAVYVSFRDISRIVKLQYPGNNILNSYGETYQQDVPVQGNGLFCGQHSCNISKDGNLYMFNNDFCSSDHMPKIDVFQQIPDTKYGLKKIWEYHCRFRPEDSKKPFLYTNSTGGNVVELPDQSFFVSMGSVYGEVFIITQDKKILWSGFPEKWNPDKNKWELIYQYRGNIIKNREEMEKLIWNSEK